MEFDDEDYKDISLDPSFYKPKPNQTVDSKLSEYKEVTLRCKQNNCNITEDEFKKYIKDQISIIQKLLNYSLELKNSEDKIKVQTRVKELVTIYQNEVERFEKFKGYKLELDLKNRLAKLKEKQHMFKAKKSKAKSKAKKNKSKKSKAKKSKSKAKSKAKKSKTKAKSKAKKSKAKKNLMK